MAEKYSTGLRNWLLGGKDLREAFDDFIIKVFSGSAPSDADQAEGVTALCTITKASQTVDATEVSTAKQALIPITVAASGAVVSIKINGTDYVYTVPAGSPSLTATALAVAQMLDGIPGVDAVAVVSNATTDGNVVVRSSIRGLALTVADGAGKTATYTIADNTVTNARSDALQWGTPASASMSKPSEVWSGVNAATGTAAWFRIVRPDDTGALLTGDALAITRRIQGAIGTSGAELNLSNINLVIGATLTIDTAVFSLPVG